MPNNLQVSVRKRLPTLQGMFLQRNNHQIFDFYHCISKSLHFSFIIWGVPTLGMPTVLLLWYLILQMGILAFRWSSQLCMITYLHSFFSWVKTKEHIDIILIIGRNEKMPVFFTIPWKYHVCVHCSVVSSSWRSHGLQSARVSYTGRRVFWPLASPRLLTVNIFTWPT